MSTISHKFFEAVQAVPDKAAIWCDGTEISYRALADRVLAWSSGLHRRGVRRGDHIGVLLPNSIAFVELMLAAADIGAVLVPLNMSLPPSAVETAFLASDVKHVVAHSNVIALLIEDATADFSRATGVWIAVGNAVGHAESHETLFAPDASGAIPLLGADADDPYILTMTSGSTGSPKPIILTQRTKMNRAAAAVEMYGVTPNDRTLAATPLYHSLAERLVLIPLLTGGTSILMVRFSPSEWLRVVESQRVSFTIAVSSQLSQIAALVTDETRQRVATLRCLVSSSALLDTPVKEELVAKLDCEFHECYGASEIAIASNLSATAARKKLKSVGSAAAGVEIKILGEDNQPVPTGQPGEIVCRTTMLYGGYYKRPEQTQEAMWGEFFRTGDLGRLDEDGFLFFLGRKKELIISGGINIYPADVESVVAASGMVKEVAAFSLPNAQLGEMVAVAVVPKDPDNFNLKEVRFHCADQLADYQQPRKWFVLNELPKNPVGKIMKSALQNQYGGVEA